jgi:hypothetical protein
VNLVLKQWADSIENSIRRALNRITGGPRRTPGEATLRILYLAILFIFTAGFVNTMLEGVRRDPQSPLILPDRAAQSLAEGFINLMMLVFGTLGVYLLYQGSRPGGMRRESGFYLVGGFAILLIAVIIGLYVLGVKRF